MKFQVPQFIEHEPKVIGPVTFRQAGYLGFPLVIIFMLYFTLAKNLILFLALAIVLEGVGAAFAFVTIGRKSVLQIVLDMLYFAMRPKTYIWKRGKASLHFRAMEYVSPKKEGLPKVELLQKSMVGDLAVKVQTKR